jgi:hypothetical protein
MRDHGDTVLCFEDVMVKCFGAEAEHMYAAEAATAKARVLTARKLGKPRSGTPPQDTHTLMHELPRIILDREEAAQMDVDRLTVELEYAKMFASYLKVPTKQWRESRKKFLDPYIEPLYGIHERWKVAMQATRSAEHAVFATQAQIAREAVLDDFDRECREANKTYQEMCAIAFLNFWNTHDWGDQEAVTHNPEWAWSPRPENAFVRWVPSGLSTNPTKAREQILQVQTKVDWVLLTQAFTGALDYKTFPLMYMNPAMKENQINHAQGVRERALAKITQDYAAKQAAIAPSEDVLKERQEAVRTAALQEAVALFVQCWKQDIVTLMVAVNATNP